MHEDHPQLYPVTDDSASAWRYMSLQKFEALLETQALYFAAIDKLSDRWEGVYTVPTIDRIRALFGRRRVREFLGLGQELRRTVYVNCWHLSAYESYAMWRIYATAGKNVAVRTSIGGLKGCVHPAPEVIHLGKIMYLDPFQDKDDKWEWNLLAPFFWKRPGFDYEREIRMLLWAGDQVNSRIVRAGLPGYAVHADLPLLIEKVYLGPDSDAQTAELVEARLARAGLSSVPVEKSAMAAVPFYKVSPTAIDEQADEAEPM